MSQVLVVYCHPNPYSFVSAARDRVLAGLAAAGHDARQIDLYAEGFDPAPVPPGAERRGSGTSPAIARYVDWLTGAEMLVLVYPTWWSGQPAMLKGWIDRICTDDLSPGSPHSADSAQRLARLRRIVVITTHGSSKLINSLEGESGKRIVTRVLRSMCVNRPHTTWCPFYGLDTAHEAARRRYLDKVERLFAAS